MSIWWPRSNLRATRYGRQAGSNWFAMSDPALAGESNGGTDQGELELVLGAANRISTINRPGAFSTRINRVPIYYCLNKGT